ncbi:MAG TPA: ABC transporter ATP-binding protein [Candidatus Binatia bacterium]|nr:ABC transporter ATP-binding protein [Candidatus Binatia bacterium]
MIAADRVSKLYGARWALNDVSFEIGQGEVVGFLGLNGAGKTTVLKILCGVLWPSAGRVRVGGHDSLESPQAVRRQCGFLPDQPPLYAEMTVRAMLRYAARLNGLEARAVNAAVEEAIETCHLREVADDLVGWLSHGYRKRVGIAQTIVHKPALVILDEPTGGLDPEQIVGMRGLIRTLAQRHTVLISSHILAEIERTCDRLLVLHEGRIVAQGTEEELRGGVLGGRMELTVRGAAGTVLDLAAQVPGVGDAQLLETRGEVTRISVRVSGDAAAEKLVTTLVQAGLGVRAAGAAQGGGLEPVFLQLTRGAQPS